MNNLKRLFFDSILAYAILDIEAISLEKDRVFPYPGKFSKTHNCTRKLAIILFNNKFRVLESQPCIHKRNLTQKELSSFNYCYKNIHKLPYYPQTTLKCSETGEIVKSFLQENNIRTVFFKGGVLEKDFCEKIGYKCFNLELLRIPKANSHSPLSEVQFYKQELEKLF